MTVIAIVPAAGTGSRFSNTQNKLLADLNGKPVIVRTLEKISAIEKITDIIIPASPEILHDIENLVEEYNLSKVKTIIPGGKTRQQSVFLSFQKAKILIEAYKKPFEGCYALIHDGARPLIAEEVIENLINTATTCYACIAAVPVKDTIKKINSSSKKVVETLNRKELWSVQTPQVFRFTDILEAHEKFAYENIHDFTDDAGMLEAMGFSVSVCMGSYKNIKITTEEDLKIASLFL